MKQKATEWSLEYIVNNYQGQEFSLTIKYAKIAITVPVANAWPERGSQCRQENQKLIEKYHENGSKRSFNDFDEWFNK